MTRRSVPSGPSSSTGWSRRAGLAVQLRPASVRSSCAVELARPLIVFEPLRVGYPWASDRLHAFVLQGMADNARAFAADAGALLPLRRASAGRGQRACSRRSPRTPPWSSPTTTPVFFLPRMIAAAAARARRAARGVDGNGLLPLRAVGPRLPDARSRFARTCRRRCRAHLDAVPRPIRSRGVRAARPRLPARRCEHAGRARRRRSSPATPRALAALPIDHARRAVAGARRGATRRAPALADVRRRRPRPLRRRPQRPRTIGATSGLSPYLHFGHVSAHEIFDAVADARGLDAPSKLAASGGGKREGWWGVDAAAPRRSSTSSSRGASSASTSPRTCADYDRYDSLPGVGAATLAAHAARSAAAPSTRSRRVRAGRDARPAVERGADASWCARAASTTTCACCGARRSSMVAHAAATRSRP